MQVESAFCMNLRLFLEINGETLSLVYDFTVVKKRLESFFSSLLSQSENSIVSFVMTELYFRITFFGILTVIASFYVRLWRFCVLLCRQCRNSTVVILERALLPNLKKKCCRSDELSPIKGIFSFFRCSFLIRTLINRRPINLGNL